MTKYATLTDLALSPDVAALNPQLRPTAKVPKTDARKQLEREIRETFARTFEVVWKRNGGPSLETEFKFCPTREWRADYRIGNVLIELEGGVFSGGRHNRSGGYSEDCAKYNMAAMLGYTVIRIPTGFATDNYLQQIIKFLQEQHGQINHPSSGHE
jgi:very-short-patch-repair endonuclease